MDSDSTPHLILSKQFYFPGIMTLTESRRDAERMRDRKTGRQADDHTHKQMHKHENERERHRTRDIHRKQKD